MHENLRCRRKRKKRYGTNAKRGVLVNQISLDERPALVNEKTRLGAWEVDLVIGKGHQQSIVTMVERKSKLLRMKKIEHKTGSLTRSRDLHRVARLGRRDHHQRQRARIF